MTRVRRWLRHFAWLPRRTWRAVRVRVPQRLRRAVVVPLVLLFLMQLPCEALHCPLNWILAEGEPNARWDGQPLFRRPLLADRLSRRTARLWPLMASA
mgnify:CR=1 FL=1